MEGYSLQFQSTFQSAALEQPVSIMSEGDRHLEILRDGANFLNRLCRDKGTKVIPWLSTDFF
jgi:hypothetical protein